MPEILDLPPLHPVGLYSQTLSPASEGVIGGTIVGFSWDRALCLRCRLRARIETAATTPAAAVLLRVPLGSGQYGPGADGIALSGRPAPRDGPSAGLQQRQLDTERHAGGPRLPSLAGTPCNVSRYV